MPFAPLAALSTTPTTGLVDSLALVVLAVALVLPAIPRLAVAARLLAGQSIVLALMVGLLAAAGGSLHLWVVAGLTLVIKGLVVPRILFFIIDRLKIRRETEPVLPTRLTLVLAAGLTVLAYWVTRPLDLPGGAPGSHALPVAVASILLGGLLMVTRRKALMQIVGLMVMENGLYLAAMVVTGGMPLVVELGILFDLLIGVLVMGVIAFRINQTFDTISVDRLRRLRH